MIKVPTSIGELLDKLSILNIKSFKITDKEKLRIVRKELRELTPLAEPYMENHDIEDLYSDLISINIGLWEIEDALRILEKNQEFDGSFITLARSVYKRNDERANIKRKINQLLNEDIVEVKQYINYNDTRKSKD